MIRRDAIALDYSLQLEAGFTRMCAACREQKMTGATPDLCRLPGSDQVAELSDDDV